MKTTPASHSFQSRLIALLSGFAFLAAAAQPGSAGAIKFEEPDRRPPQGTVGGGSRTGGPKSILSLLPDSGFGTTNQARPTFLVYTAAPLTTDTVARFYLRDADSGKQYEAIVPLNPQGGIVSFSLPASFQDLEISRPYHWFLVLNTGDRPPSVETPFARGTIERVAATAETARGLEISLESAASAGREGRWYDVAAILAILRQNRPEDPTLNASWEELLESVRLGWLADSPLASNAER